MTLIDWDEEKFGVDIDSLDRHHRQWIALVNELNESLVGTDTNLLPEDAAHALLDYTTRLFAEEEELMREIDYPGYSEHIKSHAVFMLKLKHIEEALGEGHFLVRTKTLAEIKAWLEQHITEEDRGYGDYLAEGYEFNIPILHRTQ